MESSNNQQINLNPENPSDAVKIIDILTREASWPGQNRNQINILNVSLHTLTEFVKCPVESEPTVKE